MLRGLGCIFCGLVYGGSFWYGGKNMKNIVTTFMYMLLFINEQKHIRFLVHWLVYSLFCFDIKPTNKNLFFNMRRKIFLFCIHIKNKRTESYWIQCTNKKYFAFHHMFILRCFYSMLLPGWCLVVST